MNSAIRNRVKIKRNDIYALLVGFILSCCQIVGRAFINGGGHVYLRDYTMYLKIIGVTLIVTVPIMIIYRVIRYFSFVDNIIERKLTILFAKVGRKAFFLTFLLLLICYLPIFLYVFPGYYAYDGPTQIYDLLHNHSWSAAHPIFHTAILGVCFFIGNALFGSYTAGLALYSAVCALAAAMVFSYVCKYMADMKIPKVIIVLSFIYFALNPLIQLYLFVTTKDMLYALSMLLLFLFSVDIMLNPGRFFTSAFRIIRFILMVIIMCFLRNQGIYIMCLFAPFFVIACKGHRIKSLLVIVSSILIVWGIQGPISSFLNIAPSNFREALSVPMQQLVRVVHFAPESLAEEEKDYIHELIAEEGITGYLPFISDPVKSYFDIQVFKDDPVKFAKIYLAVGMNNINIYFDSFLWGSLGYYYIGNTNNLDYGYWTRVLDFLRPDSKSMTFIEISKHNFFPLYGRYFEKIESGAFLRLPFFSIVCGNALPFFIMLFVLGYLFFSRKYKLAVPLILLFAYWLTLLIGPVVLLRYTLPLMISAPAVVSLLFLKTETENNIVV